ncbi:hypothetical protein MPSEU_000222700 [Mayamaea pseudoterrestris]|nr:hypothetical protein MPSEU_000222700 [Mayamaea pseudoterrestris]
MSSYPTTNSESMEAAGRSSNNHGSWLPMAALIMLLLIRWLYFGAGDIPTRFRRWSKLQSLRLRQSLGFRDNSVYKSGAAGHGASAKVKRQG